MNYLQTKRKCVPCTTRMVETKKVTTGLLVFFQMLQKFTKGVCMIRSIIFLKIRFLDVNVQKALFSMVKKMLLTCDTKEVCEAVLTDLSKYFDCISHDPLMKSLNKMLMNSTKMH